MEDEYTKILKFIKSKVTDSLTARVKDIEDVRLKKVEDLVKGTHEIVALRDAVKKQDVRLGAAEAHSKQQVGFERAQLTKAYTELIHAEVAKMEKKLAQTEVLEARLKGMETMIRSMEQTIDMLQRRR